MLEFLDLFTEEWAGDTEEISAEQTIENAFLQLDKSTKNYLAIVQGAQVVAYANDRDLLKAALAKETGATA
ncbi:hypothetical protein [Planococcus faecalis]|uniref:hypothetical protein n=1 Tax=Planococcus faecalis TaxID=1598147 RepID=UPI00210F0F01|nr:hypothetical protein [Planococcus faecalis]